MADPGATSRPGCVGAGGGSGQAAWNAISGGAQLALPHSYLAALGLGRASGRGRALEVSSASYQMHMTGRSLQLLFG